MYNQTSLVAVMFQISIT